jgi:hypothetical protein
LAEAIDGMASMGEANIVRLSRGLVPILPGMNGPVNTRRMDEISRMVATFRDALFLDTTTTTLPLSPSSSTDHQNGRGTMPTTSRSVRHSITNHAVAPNPRNGAARLDVIRDVVRSVSTFLSDDRIRRDAEPLVEELQSVIQMVALEILEIRGSRAMRSMLQLRSES